LSRTLCRVLGVIFVLGGLAGLAEPDLLGLHLTTAHNVVHILSGLVTLYVGFAGSTDAVRGLGLALGSAYALLAVVGVVAPGFVAGLFGHSAQVDATALAADNLLHVLMAGAFFLVALGSASPRRTHQITRLDLL
jgi:hypothetical protein